MSNVVIHGVGHRVRLPENDTTCGLTWCGVYFTADEQEGRTWKYLVLRGRAGCAVETTQDPTCPICRATP